MRQIVVFLFVGLVAGGPGSAALAQMSSSGADEAPESTSRAGHEPGSGGLRDAAHLGAGSTLGEAAFLSAIFQAEAPWRRSFGEEVGARDADLELARLFDAPVIAATREDLGSDGVETQASVSWQLPRTDRRRLDLERASAEVAAAGRSLERSTLDFALEGRRAYARWALASREVEVLEAESDLLRDVARRTEERGRVGESSGLEVRRLRLAELEAKARTTLARAELTAALGDVAPWRPDLLARDPALSPLLPSLPPAPVSDPPQPPDVSALEAEVRAAEAAAELARRVADAPSVTLGWRRLELDSGPTAEGPVIGMSWGLPLSGRGRAERRRAEARREASLARLDLARSRYASRLRSAEASYAELRAAVADSQEALADVVPAVRAARAAFRLGETDLTTLLDTVRTATGARLAALELLSSALEHQRRLEQIRGEFFTHPDLNHHFRR